jgi:anti-sigma B factor antagonist
MHSRLSDKMNTMTQTLACEQSRDVAGFRGENKESKLKFLAEIRSEDDVTIVQCSGRITYREEAGSLSGEVAALLPHTRQLVLDLGAVEVVDSAGLGELVTVRKWTEESGCSLKLAAPQHHIRRVLELTNLKSVFEIYPTADEAVMSFRGQLM